MFSTDKYVCVSVIISSPRNFSEYHEVISNNADFAISYFDVTITLTDLRIDFGIN